LLADAAKRCDLSEDDFVLEWITYEAALDFGMVQNIWTQRGKVRGGQNEALVQSFLKNMLDAPSIERGVRVLAKTDRNIFVNLYGASVTEEVLPGQTHISPAKAQIHWKSNYDQLRNLFNAKAGDEILEQELTRDNDTFKIDYTSYFEEYLTKGQPFRWAICLSQGDVQSIAHLVDQQAILAASTPAGLPVGDQIKLKSGVTMDGKVKGFDEDSVVFTTGDKTQQVGIETIAEMRADIRNPKFWGQIANSALKRGNGTLAFNAAMQGQSIDKDSTWFKVVLDYPNFSETALAVISQRRNVEDLTKARVAAKARCDGLMAGDVSTVSAVGSAATTNQGHTSTSRVSALAVATDNSNVMDKESADAWAKLKSAEEQAENAQKDCAKVEGQLTDLCFAMWKRIGLTVVAVMRGEADQSVVAESLPKPESAATATQPPNMAAIPPSVPTLTTIVPEQSMATRQAAGSPTLPPTAAVEALLRMGMKLDSADPNYKAKYKNWHDSMRVALEAGYKANGNGSLTAAEVGYLGGFDAFDWDRSGGAPDLGEAVKYVAGLMGESLETPAPTTKPLPSRMGAQWERKLVRAEGDVQVYFVHKGVRYPVFGWDTVQPFGLSERTMVSVQPQDLAPLSVGPAIRSVTDMRRCLAQ
jgi:hypothetical protein